MGPEKSWRVCFMREIRGGSYLRRTPPTESLNIALKGLFSGGNHVITTVLEHNSVLRPLYECRENGVELTILGCDGKGRISYEEMEAAVQADTKAVVCTHASNLTGNMIELERVGTMAKRHGLLFVVDASQTAGVWPIDVEKMQIDVLCFTGHKSLLGPQGTGGMYVREGVHIRPLLSGGSGIDTYNEKHPAEMPTALEAGTLNGHGIAGLGAALFWIEKTDMDRIRRRELSLMRRFYDGVFRIPGVTVYGDFETEKRAPVVSLNILDYDSSEVSDELSTVYGISTRKNISPARWNNRVSPVAPPGKSPPVRTKVLMFSAMRKDAMTMTMILFISFCGSNFITL